MKQHTIFSVLFLLSSLLLWGCTQQSDLLSSTPETAVAESTTTPPPTVTPLPTIINQTADPQNTAIETIIPNVPDRPNLTHVFYEDYVITAAGEDGLFIRSLANYDSPIPLAFVDMPAWDVAISDQTAYVLTCNHDCLTLVDLSIIEQPQLINAQHYPYNYKPITHMAIDQELIYLVADQDNIRILNLEFAPIATIPFTHPVSDLVVQQMSVGANENDRFLNIAVQEQGIYGIHVPMEDPQSAKLIGFQEAPRPQWHIENSGIINSIWAVDDVLFATAGSQGLREYLSWEERDSQPSYLWASDFDYVTGDAIHAVYDDKEFVYLLSETEDNQYITTIALERREEDSAWNTKRWFVDEVILTGDHIDQLAWHNETLWALTPDLRPVTAIQSSDILWERVEAQQISEAAPQPDPKNDAWQLVEEQRYGGNLTLRAQYENYVYASLDEDLLIYDITEPTQPILINTIPFGYRVGEMAVYKTFLLMNSYNYHGGASTILDLSNPEIPTRLNENWEPLYFDIRAKDDILFTLLGIYVQPRFAMFEEVDGKIQPITDTHPLNQIYPQAAQQISIDSNGLIALELDQVKDTLSSFVLSGDLLVIHWFDVNTCPLGRPAELDECQAGILWFDLSDQATPSLLGSQSIPYRAELLTLDPTWQLTINPDHSASESITIDLSSTIPSDLTWANYPNLRNNTLSLEQIPVSDFLTGANISDITVAGDSGYITDKEGNLFILDLTNLPEISLQQKIELPYPARNIKVHQQFLLLESADYVMVYEEVESGTAIERRTISYDVTEWSDNPFITAFDDWLIHGQGQTLIIESLAEQGNSPLPTPKHTLTFPYSIEYAPHFTSEYTYIIGRGALVFTLDTNNLIQNGNIDILQSMSEIDIDGPPALLTRGELWDGRLYFGCNYGHLCVFDITQDKQTLQLIYDVERCLLDPIQIHNRSDSSELTQEEFLQYTRLEQDGCYSPSPLWKQKIIAVKDNYLLQTGAGSELIVYRAEPITP